MFKIELDPFNTRLAGCLGRALCEYANCLEETGRSDLGALSGNNNDIETYTLAPLEDPTYDVEKATSGSKEEHHEQKTNPGRVDEHGVPFHKKYCATAADPFYKTGKMAGQWKKARGVTQEEYDIWYVASMPEEGLTGSGNDEGIDTGSAFSGGDAGTKAPDAPKTGGEFMVWVSEMQTAGHLTQPDMNEAYAITKCTPGDLFGDKYAVTVANLYGVLSSRIPS